MMNAIQFTFYCFFFWLRICMNMLARKKNTAEAPTTRVALEEEQKGIFGGIKLWAQKSPKIFHEQTRFRPNSSITTLVIHFSLVSLSLAPSSSKLSTIKNKSKRQCYLSCFSLREVIYSMSYLPETNRKH